jgi:D-arabinose 1-dehydrogenase-like Zn-dependent alcohol dehydrogenase
MAAFCTAVRTMKVAQLARPGAAFEIVAREVPESDGGQVRIRVQACGISHSDALIRTVITLESRIHAVPGWM